MIATKYLFVLFVGLFFSSCDHDTIISDLEEQIIQNNDSTSYTGGRSNADSTKSILSDKTINDSLKILAIGNSFTDDATVYLPNLIKSANLSRIKVARVVHGGSSLEYHYNHAKKNDDVYDYYKSVGGNNFNSYGKISLLKALCDDKWDIVVLQQLSQYSGRYDTYQPYLDSLIVLIHRQQPKTIIGWQMTWAYSSNSNHAGFAYYNNDQIIMYDAINQTMAKVLKEANIDIVIPTGIAIQQLRNTYVNNPPLDLTRDGYHLDYGAGRYTAACTWYESLISTIYQTSIIGNTYRVKAGNVHVTDENAKICQEAASNAVKGY